MDHQTDCLCVSCAPVSLPARSPSIDAAPSIGADVELAQAAALFHGLAPYGRRVATAMLQSLSQLQGESVVAGPSVDWIPIGDRLPDADSLVLIATTEREVWTGYLDGETWRFGDGMPAEWTEVTHWMHFPAAPAMTDPDSRESANSSTSPEGQSHG